VPSERALFAEFPSVDTITAAVVAVRRLGRMRLDAYTPHPVIALEELLQIPRSRTPWVALAGGLAGASSAFLLQYWLNGVLYPLNVGGKPALSIPAYVPIAFEMAILGAALAGFVAWLVVTRLPALDEPVLTIDGLASASVDRFWLSITLEEDAVAARVIAELKGAGAVRILRQPEGIV
jgi:hypothetical protein